MIFHTFQDTDAPTRAVLGLHGWTGDELSMESIAKSVSSPLTKWFMPRAPYDADTGDGYTWFSGSDEAGWKYDKTVEMMSTILGTIAEDGFLPNQTFIVGFSMVLLDRRARITYFPLFVEGLIGFVYIAKKTIIETIKNINIIFSTFHLPAGVCFYTANSTVI